MADYIEFGFFFAYFTSPVPYVPILFSAGENDQLKEKIFVLESCKSELEAEQKRSKEFEETQTKDRRVNANLQRQMESYILEKRQMETQLSEKAARIKNLQQAGFILGHTFVLEQSIAGFIVQNCKCPIIVAECSPKFPQVQLSRTPEIVVKTAYFLH